MGTAAFANPADNGGRAGATNGIGTPFELAFWESVGNSNDRAQLEAYLAQYPNGTFSGLARAKIAGLAPSAPLPTTASTPVTASPPVPATSAVMATTAVYSPAPAAQPTTPAVTPAAAIATAPLSLLDQLAAVGNGSLSEKHALFTSTGPVPSRPALAPVAAMTIPDHFCSAVERNRFHDTVYVPTVAQADRNNAATIAHLQNVQALHAQALAANNIAGANALAHEATEFKPIADQSYTARTAMTDFFARIMAAPITGC